MKTNLIIKKLVTIVEFRTCASVIRKSFLTVAKDLNLSKKNAPTNPAFITYEKLKEEINKKNIIYFGLYPEKETLAGCVAIERADNDIYYMERLAVLPEYRHKGFGVQLIDFVVKYVKSHGGKKISIGIINENDILKKWYIKQGFHEINTSRFDHLPFTVCFLEKIF